MSYSYGDRRPLHTAVYDSQPDIMVNHAAALLQRLYAHDYQDLQSQIGHLLGDIQDYGPNPKMASGSKDRLGFSPIMFSPQRALVSGKGRSFSESGLQDAYVRNHHTGYSKHDFELTPTSPVAMPACDVYSNQLPMTVARSACSRPPRVPAKALGPGIRTCSPAAVSPIPVPTDRNRLRPCSSMPDMKDYSTTVHSPCSPAASLQSAASQSVHAHSPIPMQDCFMSPSLCVKPSPWNPSSSPQAPKTTSDYPIAPVPIRSRSPIIPWLERFSIP